MILRHCLYQHFHLSYELPFLLFDWLIFRKHKYLTLTASYSPHSAASSGTMHFWQEQETPDTLLSSAIPTITDNKTLYVLCYWEKTKYLPLLVPQDFLSLLLLLSTLPVCLKPIFIHLQSWVTYECSLHRCHTGHPPEGGKYKRSSVSSYCICKSFLKLDVIASTFLEVQYALASCQFTNIYYHCHTLIADLLKPNWFAMHQQCLKQRETWVQSHPFDTGIGSSESLLWNGR